MLFPTTIVGSFPQPEWLIDREKLAGRFPPRVRAKELWRIPPQYLEQAQNDATLIAIRAQEEAGLDIVSDGEIRRESYSNRFATALEGVDLDNPGSALDRSGHPNPVPRIVGRDPPQARGGGGRPQVPARAHHAQGEDHRAGAVHDAAAGAERPLQERRRGGDGLRGRRQRRDQGPVCRRRRRGADRRALHAGAAGEGAPVRPAGAEPCARRRDRHDRRAHLLRLRGHHPPAAERLLVLARTGAVQLQAGVDRDGAVEARLLGAHAAGRQTRDGGLHRPRGPERRVGGNRRASASSVRCLTCNAST